MKVTWSGVATALAAATLANAHFQISYPVVRGPFNDDNEPQFCDGYTNPANRTLFPLTNGTIFWNGSHESWTVGVMISTAASPTSFNDFHTSSGGDQLVVSYFQGTGLSGCIRIEPTAAGIPGIQNGSNVTFQMVFDGGDGKLYQCMDVTLSENVTVPSNLACASPQGQPPSNQSGSPTSSGSPSSTGSSTGGGPALAAVNGVLGLSLAGMLAVVLV